MTLRELLETTVDKDQIVQLELCDGIIGKCECLCCVLDEEVLGRKVSSVAARIMNVREGEHAVISVGLESIFF